MVMNYLWKKPLNPSLNLPTQTPEQITVNPSPGIPAIVAMSSSTPTKEPLCGGPALMMILATGSDFRQTGYLYGLSDVIRIIRIDFTIPRVVMLDFPRDIWVEIPDISAHYGITHGKLNQAYFYGTPGMGYYDGPAGGSGLLARTLQHNFGLQVDHYIAIDMKNFVKAIDAIGGVDIYLSETVYGWNEFPHPDKPDFFFPAGEHHFNGQQALDFSRNRWPTTFQREKFQDMILTALQEKVLSPSVLPRLPQLVDSMIGSVLTDLSPSNMRALVCLVSRLSKSTTIYASFPEEIFKPSNIYDPHLQENTFIYDVDFNQIKSYVNKFIDGTWPPP